MKFAPSLALFFGLSLALAPIASAQDSAIAEFEKAVVDVVTKVSPTFVVIGGGSGVVISEDGFMLTNHHVAGSRPIGSQWRIKLPSGKIYLATMVGTDPQGDISLLKIAGEKGEKFKFVPFGDSDKLTIGDWVVALGNPFGFAKDSTPTVTIGLVSAFNRFRGNYGDAIQTDTPINSGNSGGPLINIKGELVGINGSITTRHGVKINSGAGYAISINQIKRFMAVLKKGGVVSHGQVAGLRVTNSDKGGDGAVVRRVTTGSDAEKAGFQAKDLIVAVQGLPVTNAARFMGAVSTFPAGSTVSVTLWRAGKKQDVEVALAKAVDRRFGARPRTPRRSSNGLGMRLKNSDDGITVLSTVDGSPAARAGFTKGDLILAFEGQTVQTLRELGQLISKKKPGEKGAFKVRRKGTDINLTLTFPKP